MTEATEGLRVVRVLLATLVATATTLAGTAGDVTLDVQAHRGCRGQRPENSIPAFQRAIELGIPTLELDLQITRDRVVIVHHDQRPGAHCRYDNGRKAPNRPFIELDYADLAEIDCGSRTDARFPEQVAVPGTRIPKLDDVARLARDAPYPVRISVEIKLQSRKAGIPAPEFVKLVVDRLRAAKLESRAMVESFEPDVLRVVAELAPDIPRAILVRNPGGYDAAIEESGATALSPKHGALRREHVTAMQARGIAVIPWTVNEPDDIRRILDLGVDGIISDYPERVLAIRDESRASPQGTRGCVGAPGDR